MFKKNNTGTKILTPNGYRLFEGIQKVVKDSCDIQFKSGKTFRCSLLHPLCIDLHSFKFKTPTELVVGDILFGENGSEEIKQITSVGIAELYDIVGVEETACYFTDGILSHNCQFLNTGTSSMDRQLYEELKKHIAPPIETLMDGKYKIWEHPNPEHLYVVGVDVSEGVGGDYSVIKILDITDLREIVEVAEYYDNTIPVAEFTAKLYEILQHWGKPLVCIERNNQGAQVADRLGIDLGYPRMVNYGSKIAGRKSFELLGMVSQRNTKYHAVANARYFYSDKRAVVFRNDHSLEELFKDFVKINDTWQAASGKHDDRTMALVWALMILDRDVCERWFTIEELDDSGKPLKISPLDYGIKYFESPTSIYTNEQIANIEHSMLSPMAFGAMSEKGDEMTALLADGWTFLQGSAPYIDPNRNISRDQYDCMDKYFG